MRLNLLRGALEALAISALIGAGVWLVLYLWIHSVANGRLQ
jgi:hypothetical protein